MLNRILELTEGRLQKTEENCIMKHFIIYSLLFAKYWGHQIKKDEMGGVVACWPIVDMTTASTNFV
jgi:hypothetical protein